MNLTNNESVYIIDDQKEARETLSTLLQLNGFNVVSYPCGEDFFAHSDPLGSGCLVTDLKMDNMSGFEVLSQTSRRRPNLAVVVVSGFASVKQTVELMRMGAVTLIQKPYGEEEIISAVDDALELSRDRYQNRLERDRVSALFETLEHDQLQLIESIVTGQNTKSIALKMDVSTRTVERKRTAVFDKLAVNSVGDLTLLYAKWEQLCQCSSAK